MNVLELAKLSHNGTCDLTKKSLKSLMKTSLRSEESDSDVVKYQ
jgi:hypothetical protein